MGCPWVLEFVTHQVKPNPTDPSEPFHVAIRKFSKDTPIREVIKTL